jgi:hypothetical protein
MRLPRKAVASEASDGLARWSYGWRGKPTGRDRRPRCGRPHRLAHMDGVALRGQQDGLDRQHWRVAGEVTGDAKLTVMGRGFVRRGRVLLSRLHCVTNRHTIWKQGRQGGWPRVDEHRLCGSKHPQQEHEDTEPSAGRRGGALWH